MRTGCFKYHCMASMKKLLTTAAIEDWKRMCNSENAEKATNHSGDLCIKAHGCATEWEHPPNDAHHPIKIRSRVPNTSVAGQGVAPETARGLSVGTNLGLHLLSGVTSHNGLHATTIAADHDERKYATRLTKST